MKGFFKRNTRKMIIIGTVLGLLAGWALGTGLVKVEPQTVRVVKVWEPGSEQAVAKPFINDSDKIKFYFSWPRIPGTDIGVKEETYSLSEPIIINTEVELFSVYELTGNEKDANKVAYLVISGTVEVIDWDKFIQALDKIRARSENKEGSRMDFLNEEIQLDAYFGFFEYCNENFADFTSRVYFAHKFSKDFNLKSPEEVEEFLKNQRPWYWALGPTYLKQFQEQVKRNVFPDSFMLNYVYYPCYIADELETALQDIEWRLSLIENQKEILYQGFDEATLERAESIFSQFLEYLKDRGKESPFIASDAQLSDFLVQQQIKGVEYSSQEIYIVRTLVSLEREKRILLFVKDYYETLIAEGLRPYFTRMFEYIDETEFALWRTAIEESFQNPEFQLAILRGDYYNQWLKSTDGMEHFKKYWERRFLTWLLERDLGIELDLSSEIQERAQK